MIDLNNDVRNEQRKSNDTVNILFIVENNSVPPDIRVWREASTAKLSGYSVSIISPQKGNLSKKYEVVDEIEIYRHPSVEHRGGKLNQVVEYINAMIWEVLLCIRVFTKKRIHIIHAANPPDHIFIIVLLFRLFGVKFIFDHHDLAPELYLSKYNGKKNVVYRALRLMEKYSCLTANAIISTNQSYKKHIIHHHGVDPDKIFIVRNDPEKPQAIKSRNEEKNRNKSVIDLVYVGSINIQDGVDLLIKVVNILVSKLNQNKIRCTVVGDGDDLPHVKRLCEELNMEPYINFTGYICNRARVQALIEEADICVETAPYNDVNSRSTFIKVMEYMAAGKPIVAFDLEETRYSTLSSALLIEPGNLEGFAEAIGKLIKDPDLREKLGSYGHRRINEKLNWETSSHELIRAYDYVYGR